MRFFWNPFELIKDFLYFFDKWSFFFLLTEKGISSTDTTITLASLFSFDFILLVEELGSKWLRLVLLKTLFLFLGNWLWL